MLEYRDQGFLPEAMRNYLLRLGWSPREQEVFSTEEMIEYAPWRTDYNLRTTLEPVNLIPVTDPTVDRDSTQVRITAHRLGNLPDLFG